LQTASALWQHHLDRSLASDDSDHRDIQEPRSAGTLGDRRHEDRQRPTQPPAVRPGSPPPRRPIEPRSSRGR
jgi:hypothetical protein